MIEITKAIEIVKRETGVLVSESVDLNNAVGRVLAESIVADTDLPPFDRSQMDGFAVVAADTKNAPVTLTILGESAAGKGWHHTIKHGEAVRIMTGAPVPVGADAVQKVELTTGGALLRSSEADVAGEAIEAVNILEPVKKGTAIVKKGAEVEEGSKVFLKGEVVTENMIAAIASFGYAMVKVFKRPRVGILATGSEIVDVTKKPGRDQIRNSNSLMLKALAESCGAVVELYPIVGDSLKDLKAQISQAVGLDKSAIRNPQSEILIITGGVSVGKYDLTKLALAELGAEIFFERVRLKPGKPTVFARLNKTLIFGLPGNPVSAAVTFYLFVRLAILQMQGSTETQLRKGFAVLGNDVKAAKDRDTYLPSRLETNESGQLIAQSLKWLGSSDFIGFARADSLIFVPAGKSYKMGEVVEINYL